MGCLRAAASHAGGPGCPKMTASRSIPSRCPSSNLPGPRPRRLDRSRQRPDRPVRPRRCARRMVRGLPAGHQGRPRLTDRPRLEHRARHGERTRDRRKSARHRAGPRDLLADKGFNGKAFAAQLAARGTAMLVRLGALRSRWSAVRSRREVRSSQDKRQRARDACHPAQARASMQLSKQSYRSKAQVCGFRAIAYRRDRTVAR
jgi:hypothetical protein